MLRTGYSQVKEASFKPTLMTLPVKTFGVFSEASSRQQVPNDKLYLAKSILFL